MTSDLADSHTLAAEIRLNAVSLRRGDRLLVENLNLLLKAGELLYLTGQNGVGKTSLLLALAGFLRPASGEIRCSDAALMHSPDGASKGLSVIEDLTFYATLHQTKLDIGGALEEVGLGKDTQKLRTEELSLGQRKRLSLAKVILTNRSVWLLDEPFSALDKAGQSFVENTLSGHLSHGGIAVIATHLPRSIKNHPHKTLHLSAGQT